MKKFVRTICLWLVALVLLCCLLSPIIDTGLRKMIRHNRTETIIEELLSDTINADVLIMGNSRALCSYNPVVLSDVLHKKVFNIGVSGQPLGISYMRYQLYLRHNKKPQMLIVNIDNNELEMYSSDFGHEQYYPYFSDSFIRDYLRELGFSLTDLYVPLLKYRGDYKLIGYSLMSLFNIYPFPFAQHANGYYNSNSGFDITELRAELQQRDSIPAMLEQEAIDLLSSLIQEQQRESIQTVFVYAPQYELLRKHLQMAECRHIYDSLALTYKIPLLDYSAIEWNTDSTYFYNANHVNQQGATLFTTKLAYDLYKYVPTKE